MSSPDTLAIIRTALAEFAQAPVPENTGVSLFEAGVLDSFAVMDLVASLEKAFGIPVPDADLLPRRFETLDKIAKYFDDRRGA